MAGPAKVVALVAMATKKSYGRPNVCDLVAHAVFLVNSNYVFSTFLSSFAPSLPANSGDRIRI
jgi:hypothetical protein